MILDRIKRKIFDIFKIYPAQSRMLIVNEELTHINNVLKNKILYRGNANEIEQFFKQVSGSVNDKTAARFWAVAPENGRVRKIHSGIVSTVIDFYANIIAAEFEGVTADEKCIDERINNIFSENNIERLIERAVTETLVTGDGAFKLSVDRSVSDLPVIEFYSAADVEYTYKRGRLSEIHFYNDYRQDGKTYRLEEIYGRGRISYILWDKGKQVSLSKVSALSEYADVTYNSDLILAIPLKFFDSDIYRNRGKALFEGKVEDIDALDEIISQWLDAIRKGRVKKYIPDSLLPRDMNTGAVQNINDFDDDFIKLTGSHSEEQKDTITMLQPAIDYAAYENSYKTFLDLVLQGIISPSSLGIDLKKTDNAEAQREKEKMTLFMMSIFVAEIKAALGELGKLALICEDIMQNKTPDNYSVKAGFAEYAEPTFESRAEILSNLYAKGAISTEILVDRMYGNSLSDEEKTAEVQRLKAAEASQLDMPDVGG